ncbi:MAG: CoA transferase [Candidatus Tectomicrobia bacterium]
MASAGVLQGVRVLSLEQVHVLPWGTAFLADFGAQVIRVESAEHMNDRRSGPFPDREPGEQWWNEGGTFGYWARNKESLCLQVAHPMGQDVFMKLVEHSDIVTDNFRPGTTRRLGLDHESLAAVKPDIITLSCTAYGHTGPWHAYGARARTVDSACGLSSLTGYAGGESIRASSNYMDHTGGLNVAYALLLALYRRRKTGQGMRIDLSMYETGVSCIAPAILEAQRGMVRPRLGTTHLWKAPHNIYPCQGEDRWITISVASDEEWGRLRTAMGNLAWAAAACFDTAMGRWQHKGELDEHLEQWTAGHDDQELMHLLQEHGVTAGAVLTAKDLTANSHLRERQYFDIYTNENVPRVGPRVYAGRPFRCSEMPVSLHLVSALGQHNVQILRQVAGLQDEEIQRLVDAEVIHTQPRQVAKPVAGATGTQGRERDGLADPHYQEAVQALIESQR